ncbi:TIGR01777 family protein [Robertkochia sp. 1368]|nr:TIGR01777 family oxidoreductase [Robertkochia sediminum]MBL7472277.1 TIGR01777 family protein [Robertkochia sediminum]
MRILITGATGLVGTAITELCHARGYQVNYLTTRKEKLSQDPAYRGFLWDPSRGAIDTECFAGVHAVINLAGASIAKRWTDSYKKTVLQSRVDSLETLHKGMKDSGNKIPLMVTASAIGVYPSSFTTYYEEEEEGAVANTFLGEVVAAWEKAADVFTASGTRVAKVRIGLVLSADDGALPQMVKPVQMYAGAAFGSGEQWQSWIHIRDLAGIFMHLLENEAEGVYNGVAPNPVTQNKLMQAIAKVVNKPLWLPNIPEWFIKMVLGEMSSVLLESQRVSSKKVEVEGYVFKYPNLMPALQDILQEKGQLREELAP